MKQERVILSFIMVLIGLTVAGAGFYFYQKTKIVTPSNDIAANKISPTPPVSSLFLQVVEPKDEAIADRKTIKIIGKTEVDSTVVILTVSDQQILQPSSQGDFTTTLQIGDGANYIKILAIAPNGEVKTVEKIVSYTSESF